MKRKKKRVSDGRKAIERERDSESEGEERRGDDYDARPRGGFIPHANNDVNKVTRHTSCPFIASSCYHLPYSH